MYLFSFLYGIILKVYDDIIDNKLDVDPFYIDLFKYLTISLFSILFYADSVFSFLWFEMTLLSIFMDVFYTKNLFCNKEQFDAKKLECMNDTVWVYSTILSGLFTIYHLWYNRYHLTDSMKNKTLFLFILLCGAIIITDIYITPEHASEKKLHTRIIVLLVLSVLYYLMTAYAKNILYEGNFYTILMFIGFLVTSVTYLSLDKLGFIEFWFLQQWR